jgi:hypothetical protein
MLHRDATRATRDARNFAIAHCVLSHGTGRRAAQRATAQRVGAVR